MCRILTYLFLLMTFGAFAQTPITNVNTTYQSASSGLSYNWNSATYNFGNLSGTTNHIQTVTGFSLPNGSYLYNVFIDGIVKMRRVNNANATGKKTLVWMESAESSGVYNIMPPYVDSMEVFFDGRTINKGTDNLFANQGDGGGNNNNIERVDWIINSGMVTNKPAESGFAIFERGADNAHDPFCIAPILQMDANGNPSQYGQIIRVGTSNYGNLPNSSLNYTILRKEESETRLYRTGNGNQNRGGVFISFQNLGIDSGQVMYGYSLFAYDLPTSATPADLIDYTNTTYFPTNTSANTSQGGIDLIAITGLFNTTGTDVVLPIKYSNWRASIISNKVLLNWQLENEGECRKIEIERSYDGRYWETIAGLQPSARQYIDENVKAGGIYYRLKLYDAKVFTYSTIKRISYKDNSVFDFNIRRSENLEIMFQSKSFDKLWLQITDAQGRVLYRVSYNATIGLNRLTLGNPVTKGVYYVLLRTKDAVVSRQFVY
jgi:hypothetical protein